MKVKTTNICEMQLKLCLEEILLPLDIRKETNINELSSYLKKIEKEFK